MKLDLTKTNYSLKRDLKNLQPYDIAELLYDLDVSDQIRIMTLIGVKTTSKVFSRLTKHQQIEVFDGLDTNKQKQILDNLEMDELKEFISYHEEDRQQQILSIIKPEKSNLIKDLLIYSNDLAPSIMSTEFITIDVNFTVKQATSYIFNNVRENDFIDNVYIVSDDEKLLGVVALKDLIIARSTDSINKIMDKDFLFAYNDNSVKESIEIVRNYDITSLPVIDHQGYLLGIITADDVLEQLINNYDELYHRLGYVKNHDESYSGLQRSLKRLPWLIIATILNLAIAVLLLTVPQFEATLGQVFALILFQPMILAMAGNIGTQNLAVSILGLHKEELNDKKTKRTFFRREILSGIFNSVAIAIAGFIIVAIFTFITKQTALDGHMIDPFKMGLVVASALFISMIASGIIGTVLPIILSNYNLNADNAAGPILTTLNDIIALFTYYGVAALMLVTL